MHISIACIYELVEGLTDCVLAFKPNTPELTRDPDERMIEYLNSPLRIAQDSDYEGADNEDTNPHSTMGSTSIAGRLKTSLPNTVNSDNDEEDAHAQVTCASRHEEPLKGKEMFIRKLSHPDEMSHTVHNMSVGDLRYVAAREIVGLQIHHVCAYSHMAASTTRPAAAPLDAVGYPWNFDMKMATRCLYTMSCFPRVCAFVRAFACACMGVCVSVSDVEDHDTQRVHNKVFHVNFGHVHLQIYFFLQSARRYAYAYSILKC